MRGDDDLQLGVEGDDEAVREHVEERAVLGRAEQVGNGRARQLRRRRSREVNGPEAAIGVARAQVPDDATRRRLEAVLADGNEPGPPAGCRAGGRVVTGPSLEVGDDGTDRVRDLDDGPVVEDVGDVTRAKRGSLRRGVVDRRRFEHRRVLRERELEERGVVEGLRRTAQRRRELEVVRRDKQGGPAGEVVLERVGGRRSEELGPKRRVDAFDEAQLRRPARLARRRLKRPSCEGTKRPGAADGAVCASADQRRLQKRRDVVEGVHDRARERATAEIVGRDPARESSAQLERSEVQQRQGDDARVGAVVREHGHVALVREEMPSERRGCLDGGAAWRAAAVLGGDERERDEVAADERDERAVGGVRHEDDVRVRRRGGPVQRKVFGRPPLERDVARGGVQRVEHVELAQPVRAARGHGVAQACMHAIADALVEERVGGVWCRAASGREYDVGVLEGAVELGGLRDARAAVAQPRLLGAAERRHRHASEA